MQKNFLILFFKVNLMSNCFMSLELISPKVFEKNFFCFTGIKVDFSLQKDILLGGFYKFNLSDDLLIAPKIEFYCREKIIIVNFQLEYKRGLLQVGISSKRKLHISLGLKCGDYVNVLGCKTCFNEKLVTEIKKKKDCNNKIEIKSNDKKLAFSEDFMSTGSACSSLKSSNDKRLPNYIFSEDLMSTGSGCSSLKSLNPGHRVGLCSSSVELYEEVLNKKNSFSSVAIEPQKDDKEKKEEKDFLKGSSVEPYEEELKKKKIYGSTAMEMQKQSFLVDKNDDHNLPLLADVIKMEKIIENDFSFLNEEISNRYIEINKKIMNTYKSDSENLQASQASYHSQTFDHRDVFYLNNLYYKSYYYKTRFNVKHNQVVSFENRKKIENKDWKNDDEKILLLLPMIDEFIALKYKARKPGKNFQKTLTVFSVVELAQKTVKIGGKTLKEVFKEKQNAFAKGQKTSILENEEVLDFNEFSDRLKSSDELKEWWSIFNKELYCSKSSENEYYRSFLFRILNDAANLIVYYYDKEISDKCSEKSLQQPEKVIIEGFMKKHENEKMLLFLSMVDKFQDSGYTHYESNHQFKVNLYAFQIFDLMKKEIQVKVKYKKKALGHLLKEINDDITLLSFREVDLERFRLELKKLATLDKAAKQWSNEFEKGLAQTKKSNEEYLKSFLERVMKKMSDLLILNAIYNKQFGIVNKSKKDLKSLSLDEFRKLIDPYRDRSNIYKLINYDNNLFEKYYQKRIGSSKEEEKYIEKSLAALHLYSSVHQLLKQNYRRKMIKKGDFIRNNIEKDMENLFDQKKFETTKENQSAKKQNSRNESICAKEFESFIYEKSEKIDKKYNRNLETNEYRETILQREGVPTKISFHDEERVILYKDFTLEDFAFSLIRENNFFNIDRFGGKEIDVKYCKYYFQKIYFQGIRSIEKIRKEMIGLLKEDKKNKNFTWNEQKKAVLERLKKIRNKAKNIIYKLNKEVHKKISFYKNKHLEVYVVGHIKNLYFIKKRIEFISTLLININKKDKKINLIILNLIIYPEMLTFATDWPFLFESKKEEEIKYRLQDIEGLRNNYEKLNSELKWKYEVCLREFLECVKIKTKKKFENIEGYIKSKEYFNQKIYDFYEKSKQINEEILIKNCWLNYRDKFKSCDNIDQKILQELIDSFDGSYFQLLTISKFNEFLNINDQEIQEILYFMKQNNCKVLTDMIRFKNSKSIQNQFKEFDLLDTDKYKFYKEKLFKNLKIWISNNNTKKINNLLSVKFLEDRLNDQVISPLIKFLTPYKDKILTKNILDLKYNSRIVEILANYIKDKKIKPVFK